MTPTEHESPLGVDLGTSAFKAVALPPTAAAGQRPGGDRLPAARTRSRCSSPPRISFNAGKADPRGDRTLPRAPGPPPVLAGANVSLVLLEGGTDRWRRRSAADTRAGDKYQELLPCSRPRRARDGGLAVDAPLSAHALALVPCTPPRLYAKVRYVTLDSGYYHHALTAGCGGSFVRTTFSAGPAREAVASAVPRRACLKRSALPDLVVPGPSSRDVTAARQRAPRAASGDCRRGRCFDHPSAALGAGAVEVGDLLLSCGTSWVDSCPRTDRAAALAAGLIVDPFFAAEGPWGAMFALTAIGTTIDRYLTRSFRCRSPLSLADVTHVHNAAAMIPAGKEGPPFDPLARPRDGPRGVRRVPRRLLVSGS